jgi:hypothetical protein
MKVVEYVVYNVNFTFKTSNNIDSYGWNNQRQLPLNEFKPIILFYFKPILNK